MIGTKADTLEWLAPRIRRGRVLPMAHFSVDEWTADREGVVARLRNVFRLKPLRLRSGQAEATDPLIVRSSAVGEDAAGASQAGRFLTVSGITDVAALAEAIDRVIASYADDRADHRVLVQPMLTGAIASGVVFTREPASGAPYVVVNYCEGSDTAAVTAGQADGLQTFYCWKNLPAEAAPDVASVFSTVASGFSRKEQDDRLLRDVLALAAELEQLLGLDALDFEFASTGSGVPVLFQVRPLVVNTPSALRTEDHERALASIAAKIAIAVKPHPYLHGSRTVFGIMPDWNPAEIIGVRPRPLALSLYRDLVTDSIWAYQRHNYGYKNLRSFPLLVDFHGLPYIDVRVSFNSFVPADIGGDLADRLVNHYIDRLVTVPTLHDKVEFEIVLSCYAFDLPDRLARLPGALFSPADRDALAVSLRRLTNRIISNGPGGLCRKDTDRIEELQRRRRYVMDAELDTVSRIYWLLEDCKRYGTLPFAGLARAAFVATQMLRSLEQIGVLSADELSRLMRGIETVSTRMSRDLRRISRSEFLETYGHLRPGTYDIRCPRYDEAPEHYFEWVAVADPPAPVEPFRLSSKQRHDIEGLLEEHGLEQNVVGLFEFLEAAIRNREHAKFVFTRSLSDSLSLFARLGAEHGFSRDEMSFASIGCIQRLYGTSEHPKDVLADSIAQGQARSRVTQQLLLPPLVTEPADVWRFHQLPSEPNFITRKDATGAVRTIDAADGIEGAIVMLPSADPGFDWIFSRNIAGFVTAYGGANSHMAVRAGELGLPAVIGAGKPLYERWSQAQRLRLDCLNRQVRILQ